MIQAFVGAGGKTTLIHEHAARYAAMGKKVFITTSTRMFIEEDTLLTDDAEQIIRRMNETGCVMAGIPHGEKIGPLSRESYEAVCACADVVLVEADGSKHMPIKFPSASEPVIYENVDEIVVVCGLHGLGMRLCEAAHRPELVKNCLGLDDDSVIEPHHIQKLVREGYLAPLRSAWPGKKVRVHAAHDGSLYQRAIAALLQAETDVNLIRSEWFSSQPWLVICGGGHVAGELARLAAVLDFRVRVIDDRPEFACRERFPQVDSVVCDSFANLKSYLEPNAVYVVVTRGHRDDFECVKTILKSKYSYLGMIGSKTKVQKTMERLHDEEGFSRQQLDTVFAPIGLDIHAVTPGEIAVSILAEIIREKNRNGGSCISRELLESRDSGVLCIITEKHGSSPRGVGSMMLVRENGVLDSIGGGAVEHAAIEDARGLRQVMQQEYQLNNAESARLGMICGGSNRVLFIPV